MWKVCFSPLLSSLSWAIHSVQLFLRIYRMTSAPADKHNNPPQNTKWHSSSKNWHDKVDKYNSLFNWHAKGLFSSVLDLGIMNIYLVSTGFWGYVKSESSFQLSIFFFYRRIYMMLVVCILLVDSTTDRLSIAYTVSFIHQDL